jgi:CheY-like chemotaxis protein
MLLGNLPEDDENRSSVEQIMKAGERAAELTRQLLTFSRRQVVRPKVLDLNAIVAGTAVMLRRLIGEHIELRIVAGPDLEKVHADPGQLEQVILNLAVNSRDAMPRGGTLILETQNVELDEEYTGQHHTLKPGRHAMLAVTDSGTGMDAQTRAHLFEPFFTTKPQGQGTGLGLSTVYGIVKQSGGSIWFQSEPGHGSRFTIYLPCVTGLPALRPLPPPAATVRGQETVLVVEDEPPLRELAARVLTAAGYTVLQAANGGDALALLAGHPDPVHLVFTDVVMPGMNGRELAERLATLRPAIRVLYTSGYTEDAILRHGALDDPGRFLSKPYTPSVLRHRIREALDG